MEVADRLSSPILAGRNFFQLLFVTGQLLGHRPSPFSQGHFEEPDFPQVKASQVVQSLSKR
jgi:hypothetical protein